jgi:hypothetical protein
MEEDPSSSLRATNDNLSDEIVKLDELFKNGFLTKEEFEKAKIFFFHLKKVLIYHHQQLLSVQ